MQTTHTIGARCDFPSGKQNRIEQPEIVTSAMDGGGEVMDTRLRFFKSLITLYPPSRKQRRHEAFGR